jgi:hypothetical protein
VYFVTTLPHYFLYQKKIPQIFPEGKIATKKFGHFGNIELASEACYFPGSRKIEQDHSSKGKKKLKNSSN